MTHRAFTRRLDSNTSLLSRLWFTKAPGPTGSPTASPPPSPKAISFEHKPDQMSPAKPRPTPCEVPAQAPLLQACEVAARSIRTRNAHAYMSAKLRDNDAYLAAMQRSRAHAVPPGDTVAAED